MHVTNNVLQYIFILGPASSVVSTFKKHLLYFLLDIFIDFRAGQLFDMIVDFPDSQPALEDLRDCIAKVAEMSPVPFRV